jgi:cytochrome c-type biogenesis protein CcmH
MLHLYLSMSLLAAIVALKLMHPLLRRGPHRHAGDAPSTVDRKLAGAVMCGVPVAALGIYMFLGRPDLPGNPVIFNEPGELFARQEALLSKRPLETLLKENPDDLGALLKLATINRVLGHYEEAVKFMRRAVIVAEKEEALLLRIYVENLGRLQVLANHGTVGDDALGTFKYARSLLDTDPIALFYEALAKAQHGDPEGAIEDWTVMLSQGTPLAYWKQHVREAIAVTKAGRLGVDPLNLP